ncbi:MAG: hypothetical protein CL878_06040 [Dehalococcoidia bacterium]|nr:hypothetical protein [Dehalococcoidia bacterium]
MSGGRRTLLAALTRVLRSVALVAGAGLLVLGLAFVGVSLYQPPVLLTTVNRLFPELVLQVPNNQGYFAITFDDGPNPPYTDRVLAILEEHEAQATFFFMGSQIERHPDYVAKVLAGGHMLGNHLYSTRPAILLSDQQVARALEQTEMALGGLPEPKFFRPPSIFLRPSALRVAKELGYTTVLGSAYAWDSLQHPEWYMRWAYTRLLRSGAIVVLHDGRGERQAAVNLLSVILEAAAERGLTPVTLETLLATIRQL